MIFTLHGWSFDRRAWKGTPFESGIHLELPGHGESSFKSKKLFNLAVEIGKQLPKETTLVSWSLGATVSVLVASFFPEKIKELYLFAPTAKFLGISQPEVVVKRFVRKLKRNFLNTVSEFRNLCSKEILPIPNLKPETATEILVDFCQFDLTPYTEEIYIPVKIFVGQKDRVTGLKGAISLFKKFKRCELTVLPDADHFTVLKKFSF